MKKNYNRMILFALFILLYLGIFCFPSFIMEAGVTALSIFKERLFPSIFPFFVLSFLMLNLGMTEILCRFVDPFFKRVFHLSSSASFVFLMSIFSGFPSGSKYVATLYQEKKLTKEMSHYLLLFTHFANPLFVLGSCGLILVNQTVAFFIFLAQLLSNLVIAFLFRPKEVVAMPHSMEQKSSSLLSSLADAINQAMEVLLFMLGSITFFLFFSKILLSFFPLPPFFQMLVTGLLDMTSGIAMTAELSLPLFLQSLCILSFIVFGGFSVHIQVVNALRKTDLSYRFFFLGRLLQLGIASFLFVLFYALL